MFSLTNDAPLLVRAIAAASLPKPGSLLFPLQDTIRHTWTLYTLALASDALRAYDTSDLHAELNLPLHEASYTICA